MKPGRFEKSARFVLYLFINEQSGNMVPYKIRGIKLEC